MTPLELCEVCLKNNKNRISDLVSLIRENQARLEEARLQQDELEKLVDNIEKKKGEK